MNAATVVAAVLLAGGLGGCSSTRGSEPPASAPPSTESSLLVTTPSTGSANDPDANIGCMGVTIAYLSRPSEPRGERFAMASDSLRNSQDVTLQMYGQQIGDASDLREMQDVSAKAIRRCIDMGGMPAYRDQMEQALVSGPPT